MTARGRQRRGSHAARNTDRRRKRRAGLALVALLALGGTTPARTGEGYGEPEHARAIRAEDLRHLLLEHEYGSGLDAQELLPELERLGPAAVGALYEALEDDTGPAAELPGWRSRELDLALRGVPAAVLERRRAGRGAGDVDATRVALAVLERVGSAADLATLVELASPAEEDARLERSLSRALESALSALLQRDNATVDALERRFARLHPALHAAVVQALGAGGTRAALGALGEILGLRAELDLSVLTQVNRVAANLGQPFGWSLMLRVRAYLAAADPALRREAALGAGHMEDVEAFGDLVRLLQDESAGVRENAYWALQRMSGRKLPAVAARWDAWHAAELEWWDQQAPARLAAVGMGTETERVEALSELSSHRLFRHALAKELTFFLERPEPDLVVLVCSALAGLRSPAPLPQLVGLLDRPQPELRRHAWLALRAITGRDLPEEREAWAALLPR